MPRYIPKGNGQWPWSFRSIPVCPGCVHPGAWKWNPRELVGVQSIPVRSGGCVRVVGFLACLSGSVDPALGVVWFLNSARKHTQTMAEKMDPDNPQDAREWTFSCVKNISVFSVHRSCARQWKCKRIERHSNEPGCKMERMYPTTPRAHVNHWPRSISEHCRRRYNELKTPRGPQEWTLAIVRSPYISQCPLVHTASTDQEHP